MSSDERGKQSETAGWKPMPRTIDLNAEEIEPKPEQADAEAQAAAAGAKTEEGTAPTDKAGEEAADSRQAEDASSRESAQLEAAGSDQFGFDAEASAAETDEEPDISQSETAQPIHPNPARSPRWRWLAAAAIALILAGGAATYGLSSRGWLPALPNPEAAARLAAMETQIADLAEDLAAAAASRSGNDELAARLAAIGDRLARLESAGTNTAPVPLAGEELQSIVSRLDEAQSAIRDLENRLDAMPENRDGSGVDDAAINELRAKADAAAARAHAFSAQISELQAQINSLSARFDSDLGGARDQLAESQRAAREAAAKSLRTAFERGESLGPWLDAIEAYTGPNPDLAALRDIGSAPTVAALRTGLDEAARQILDAAAMPQEGIVAGLLQNARKLVRVRPDGPVAGNSPEAILSRVEAALQEGRLGDAQTEWRQLPTQAQQAGTSWHDMLEARLSAEASLNGLLSTLSDNVSGPQDRS